MATLNELYTTLKSLRSMNLPIDEKLLKAADELEEKIIKEEILPSLSENIEPLLNEIQRELVLVVEYHPGEAISVALSRKAKISEIIDAKTLTPKIGKPVTSGETLPREAHESGKKVVNHTKGLKVVFPDGTVVCNKTAIETEIEAFRRIGFERIATLGRMRAGWPLVGREKRPTVKGKIWQHEADGWYIYSNTNNDQKIEDLKDISRRLHLHLRISLGKPK